jgi:hypothetical protein
LPRNEGDGEGEGGKGGTGGIRCQTVSDIVEPTPEETDSLRGPDQGRGEVYHRVADVEDAYLGEDGSIQCLVIWKPSLISIKNLVGEELRRRSEELFAKRYGH